MHSLSGEFIANIPQCSRKDLRNAVEAAAKAGGWAKRSAYNRGQILYRMAEMLDARASEMADAIAITEADKKTAAAEVQVTIDRMVHYAGWTDKYEALLGSVNPVASSHFNFTVTEPCGIVGIISAAPFPLLGLMSLVLPAITSGNTVVALASSAAPYPAILLGEMLATSDLPAGVVNLLTGKRSDMISTFATHAHISSIAAAVNQTDAITLQQGAAENLKRVSLFDPETHWTSAESQGLDLIRNHLEFKTTWHPVGA